MSEGTEKLVLGNFSGGGAPERIAGIRFVVFMIVVRKETETREERSRERKR